jgi:hypothetical protein
MYWPTVSYWASSTLLNLTRQPISPPLSALYLTSSRNRDLQQVHLGLLVYLFSLMVVRIPWRIRKKFWAACVDWMEALISGGPVEGGGCVACASAALGVGSEFWQK